MDVDMPSQTASSSSSSCSSEYSYSSSSSYTSGSDGSYSSSMSTPQKKGPITIPRELHTRKNVDPAMKWEMKGHIQDVKLDDLVKVSFGLTENEIKAIEAATWKLEGEDFEAYTQLVVNGSEETARYKYIKGILEHMVTQLEELDDDQLSLRGGSNSTASFHVDVDGNRPLKEDGVTRVPDGRIGWTPPTKGRVLTWMKIEAFLEIKVTRSKGSQQGKPKRQRKKGGSRRKRASQSSSIALASTSTTAYASTSMASGSTATVMSTGEKRRREDADDPQGTNHSNKRARPGEPEEDGAEETPGSGLIQKTVQMALYALEGLANCCRRWTFGLMIDNYTVTLWYFDRIGAIRSEAFEFNAETWKLALVLAGLVRCTPAQAGFEPLIVSPGATIDPQTHWPHFDRPLPAFKDAEIIVPRSVRQLEAGDQRYRIDADKLLYTYPGIIGRGTTVIPVKPLPSTSANKNHLMVVKFSFPSLRRRVLESTLIRRLRRNIGYMRKHLPKIVQARVFSLKHMNFPRFHLGLLVDEHRRLTMVVMRRYKPLWQIQTLEDFKNVFVDLVECHYHAFKHGRVLHRDLSENNLMWTYEEDGDSDEEKVEEYNSFPADCEGNEWDDEIHMVENSGMEVKRPDQVVEEGAEEDHVSCPDESEGSKQDDEALATDDDAENPSVNHHRDGKDDEIDDEDIKQLNYDLPADLRTYATASTEPTLGPEAGSVKVEVPPNDHIPRPAAVAELKPKRKAIGILGDWDLGSPVNADDTVDRSTANHRTGTQPFMASDLLSANPPPHLYRHDLESFFYVLIWAMVHYRLDGHSRAREDRRTDAALSDWESNIVTNRKAKDAIFGKYSNLAEIMECVQPVFEPLILTWVYPLYDMFAAGFHVQNGHDRYLQSIRPSSNTSRRTFDNFTLDGHVTFEAFMAAIGREPRALPPK